MSGYLILRRKLDSRPGPGDSPSGLITGDLKANITLLLPRGAAPLNHIYGPHIMAWDLRAYLHKAFMCRRPPDGLILSTCRCLLASETNVD